VNKRQKALLVESITIIVITAVAVLAMINLKDWVSRKARRDSGLRRKKGTSLAAERWIRGPTAGWTCRVDERAGISEIVKPTANKKPARNKNTAKVVNPAVNCGVSLRFT